MFDFDLWILGSGLGSGVLLKDAWLAFWEVVHGTREGPLASSDNGHLFIPITCMNHRRYVFLSWPLPHHFH
jgi:hypothetical protein